MKHLTIFQAIPLSIPYEAIFRRLGFKKDITKLPAREKQNILSEVESACEYIQLKGIARRIGVPEISPSTVKLEDGSIIRSSHLAKFLQGCSEVLFMGVTGGEDIIKAIRRATELNDLTRAVIYDAAASEVVDAALDWLGGYFRRILVREAKTLSRSRFSAGYGDFELENQKIMFELLELGQIGMSLNEQYILFPEKSVTAVARIENRERS